GTLYTAKGTASMLVPVASLLSAVGGWNAVFICAAGISIAAAIAAKFLLAPMRKRWINNTVEQTSKSVDASFQATWSETPRNSSAR
ncbi:oxalate/formate MFS antiporter, partial [Caballeronia sp. LZ024]|nr:oxalate/formate MFS antiporter [Caballeronia sp. LZ024]